MLSLTVVKIALVGLMNCPTDFKPDITYTNKSCITFLDQEYNEGAPSGCSLHVKCESLED